MKKGFEYWKESQVSKLLYAFGLGYILTYFPIVWSSVHHQQPLIFICFALVPYALLKLWKIIRRPYHDIDNRINEIDPVFYKEILSKGEEELKKANGYLAKRTIENKKDYLGLWLCKKPVKNPEIRAYIENVHGIETMCQYILFAWFATSIILILYVQNFTMATQ